MGGIDSSAVRDTITPFVEVWPKKFIVKELKISLYGDEKFRTSQNSTQAGADWR